MSTFDFTALLAFLQSLFDAFMKLFEKLGFNFGGEDAPAEEEPTEENLPL